MAEHTSVLVVDDEPEVADLMTKALRRFSGFEILPFVQDGATALRIYRELRPTVVLMDIRMPEMDGIAATHAITQADEAALVVALTSLSDRATVVAMLKAGAVGYLLKTDPPARLAQGIREAIEDDMPLSPIVLRKWLQGVTRTPQTVQISPSELQVLTLLSQGHSNAQIASELRYAEGTVKQYVSHLLTKMDCMNRTQLVLSAYRQGLVDLP